ncbi:MULTISPECIES: DoxX family protein [unclassified Curtobacterium]|uniref:DoxX family protein n=1 Tax=unclassified Curtobacterium TaxID=257496 RepID=UPI000D819080|nr:MULTISPECIES: DoxX family protein [unclassified Curtobacterium]PYY36607.1 DoxX family protein [Curtobacterium sp. MCPF17_046]WIB15083.1 DoxX family protein [Curtobacterium sp. MCPF17_050]
MSSRTTTAAVTATTLLRIALGAVLVSHGAQKLFGAFGGGGIDGTAQGMHAMGFRPGRRNAVLAGIGEAGSGAALALGLATPIAGAGAATTMGVASSVHTPNGFFNADGGLELPAFLGFSAAMFALGGPGPVSLDHATRHALDRPWLRAVALAAVPVAIAVQVVQRRKALAADAADAADAPAPTEAPAPAASGDGASSAE